MIIEFPPGTSLFFEVDENGDYTGDYVVTGPAGDPLPEPKPPTYAQPPQPKPSSPPPAEPPGSRILHATVKEGIRAVAGDLKLYSTGKVFPEKVEGWTAGGNAMQSNDRYATTSAPAGEYCTALAASGFHFDLPEGAVITGIKVTVERSKV